MTNWFKEEDSLDEPRLPKAGENETPTAPSAETKQNETTPAPEGEGKTNATIDKGEAPEEQLPFHKHPRFRALTAENKELKEQVEALSAKMENFSTKFTQQETASQPIPNWFVRLYGEDQDLYNAYKVEEEARIASMQQAVMSKLEPELKKIEKEESDKKVNSFINSELEAIKEEFPGIDTNAVMKVVYDKKLFDENGQLNFRAGAEWVVKTSPATHNGKTEAKKEVAAKLSSEGSSDGPSKKDVVTSQELRKAGDWRSFYKSL